MTGSDQEAADVAVALNRLSAAMEQMQSRYDVAERANRRVRIVLIVVLVILGAATYKALAPIADQLDTLPQLISKSIPGMKQVAVLDADEAAAERQRLMQALSPERRARIESFEQEQQWVSDYMAASANFDPGATIALFLSQMAESIQVMPGMYAEVKSMSEQVRLMNAEIQTMNGKMEALPVLASEVQGMRVQMNALPVLATEVKGMHFYMSLMARDVDSTLGEAGRMMPWTW